MTIEELRDRLAYWQKRLRLRDWRIELQVLKAADMEGVIGYNNAHWDTRVARIQIVPRDQWPADRIARCEDEDEELTLIHELLHVAFSGFSTKDDQAKGDLEHQAVNALALALFEEHRREAAA